MSWQQAATGKPPCTPFPVDEPSFIDRVCIATHSTILVIRVSTSSAKCATLTSPTHQANTTHNVGCRLAPDTDNLEVVGLMIPSQRTVTHNCLGATLLPQQALWENRDGPSVGRFASTLPEHPDQRWAVYCSEAPRLPAPHAYWRQAVTEQARSGDAAAFWTWFDAPCAGWPAVAKHVYDGPWNASTAAPLLLIGNTYDPQTPYIGTVVMGTERLAHARLLTVDGYGHTVMANPSRCAQGHVAEYLVRGELPPEGTVCNQDCIPFSPGFAECLGVNGVPLGGSVGAGGAPAGGGRVEAARVVEGAGEERGIGNGGRPRGGDEVVRHLGWAELVGFGGWSWRRVLLLAHDAVVAGGAAGVDRGRAHGPYRYT